jgi:hypothetical protein
MKRFIIFMLLAMVLVFAALSKQAMAEDPRRTTIKTGQPGAVTESGFDILKGRWVRPDGGYTISISSVDSEGKLEASYANPRPLPFAEARALRDGNAIRLFFELRAGGYNGSTYTLAYDPKKDILYGIYYQANARKRYDIYFERAE